MEAMPPTSKSESDAGPGGMNDKGKRKNTLRRAMSFPYQWGVSVFTMLYSGCETTTQVFIVSYLLVMRHANPKTVGYATSGFWGGMTIGRFIWGHYTAKLTYTQQNAFCIGIIGLAYGPVFPASLTLVNDILPPDIHMVSMAIISASASFGAALFPFLAGLISSIKGIHTLTFTTVPLTSAMAILWFLFPSRIPHRATTIV